MDDNNEQEWEQRTTEENMRLANKLPMPDSNLTPIQRVWKARRARWAAWKAANPNATPRQVDRRRSQDYRGTWQDAVNSGNERAFLKREGECD